MPFLPVIMKTSRNAGSNSSRPFSFVSLPFLYLSRLLLLLLLSSGVFQGGGVGTASNHHVTPLAFWTTTWRRVRVLFRRKPLSHVVQVQHKKRKKNAEKCNRIGGLDWNGNKRWMHRRKQATADSIQLFIRIFWKEEKEMSLNMTKWWKNKRKGGRWRRKRKNK